MTPVENDRFADLFESAFQEEESMLLCSSIDHLSLASSSIHLLSLGPRLSSGRSNSSRTSSMRLDLLAPDQLEAAGLPEGAWQRLYQRIGAHPGPAACSGASQELKKGDVDNSQVLMRAPVQNEGRRASLNGGSRMHSIQQLNTEASSAECNSSAAAHKSRPSAS
ncbi:g8675 [Coccomyxa viridis]|uniref:G8675 protein n=1 Tax=Coccomyxa viridis TaxID=1274662 RepID=A0ABP1G0X7_9CHLO